MPTTAPSFQALSAAPHPAGAAAPSFVLPRLPARVERSDLQPWQRRAMVGAILSAHAAAFWGLLQIREVREAVVDVAPMFVSLVAPPPPAIAPPPPPAMPPPPPAAVPPPPRPPTPKPVVRRRPPPSVIAAPPAPAEVIAPAPPPMPEPTPLLPEPTVVQVEPPAPAPAPAPAPPPAPSPAPAPAPKVIPASSVQYLEPPAPVYPRLSQRTGETGRVLVRVFIDEAGIASQVQVSRSSGHPRLDEAGLAAVKRARFRPYTENGRPLAGWAFIPLDFQLEQ